MWQEDIEVAAKNSHVFGTYARLQQRLSPIGWKELTLAMRHTFPIHVFWLAGVLLLLLVLEACSTGQWAGSSSQRVGATYGTPSVAATAPPKPIASSHATATSTSSPTPRSTASTPPAGGASSSAGASVLEQQVAQAVFQAINASRASAGLPPLEWSGSLVSSAHAHSALMSADNDLAHQLPGEPAIGSRISQDGVQWTWCGENIGVTSNTSESGALELHQAMMAEQPPNDGHRQNILSTNFTLVGVAIVIDASHQLWLTEDFAN